MNALAMTHETRTAQRNPDAEAYKVSEYFFYYWEVVSAFWVQLRKSRYRFDCAWTKPGQMKEYNNSRQDVNKAARASMIAIRSSEKFPTV